MVLPYINMNSPQVYTCSPSWTFLPPPSMGFSRQEHWSGLPFPSPMHEREKWKWKSLSRVRLLATPWTAANQAPPSMGFSRQEYWSGVPLPSSRDDECSPNCDTHFMTYLSQITVLYTLNSAVCPLCVNKMGRKKPQKNFKEKLTSFCILLYNRQFSTSSTLASLPIL